MANNNGKCGTRTINSRFRDEMEAFDALPKHFREIVRQASYRVSCVYIRNHGYTEAFLRRGLEVGTRLNVLAAYGPDHPQAKEVQ